LHTFEGPGPPKFDENPSKNHVEFEEAFWKPFLLIFDRFGPPFWEHFASQIDAEIEAKKDIQKRAPKKPQHKSASP